MLLIMKMEVDEIDQDDIHRALEAISPICATISTGDSTSVENLRAEAATVCEYLAEHDRQDDTTTIELADGRELPLMGQFPDHISAALDMLVEWATTQHDAMGTDVSRDDLKNWIAGALEVQIVEPDFEQIDEATETS